MLHKIIRNLNFFHPSVQPLLVFILKLPYVMTTVVPAVTSVLKQGAAKRRAPRRDS